MTPNHKTPVEATKQWRCEPYGEHRFMIYEGDEPICELSCFDIPTRNQAITRAKLIVKCVNEAAALEQVAIAAEEFLEQLAEQEKAGPFASSRRLELVEIKREQLTKALAHLRDVRGGKL